jgi:hypothetical protein
MFTSLPSHFFYMLYLQVYKELWAKDQSVKF